MEYSAPFVTGKECGNGVAIEDEGGRETQYCHMRKGPVLVKAGDKVGTGTKLGLVGQSGMADFPHVHHSVRHNGTKIDPLEPDSAATCNPTPAPNFGPAPSPRNPTVFSPQASRMPSRL